MSTDAGRGEDAYEPEDPETGGTAPDRDPDADPGMMKTATGHNEAPAEGAG